MHVAIQMNSTSTPLMLTEVNSTPLMLHLNATHSYYNMQF